MTTIQQRLKRPTGPSNTYGIHGPDNELTPSPPVKEDDPTTSDYTVEEAQLAKIEELPAEAPQAPQEEMVNPFGGDDTDLTSIHAAMATIDPDPSKLPLIANSSNPRCNAIGDTVTDYISMIASNKQANLSDLGKFGKSIIQNCMKHQIGQQGKDNRAIRFLDMLKAERANEQQQELSGNDRAFGKR